MWETSPAALLWTAHAVVVSYLAVVLVLRVTGKRILSKWNAFDFIVTVAFGSILATMILSRDVSIPAGIVALAGLAILQFVVTGLSVRLGWFGDLVKAEPALLVHDGRILHDRLRRERVSEAELLAALRGHGIGAVAGVHAVVLETDGSFSVVEARSEGEGSTLRGVTGYGADDAEGSGA